MKERGMRVTDKPGRAGARLAFVRTAKDLVFESVHAGCMGVAKAGHPLASLHVVCSPLIAFEVGSFPFVLLLEELLLETI